MIENSQDLGRELQRMWNVKVKIIPLVIVSLGAIPKQVLQQEEHKFRRQFYLERLEYQERFLKSKAIGCGSISTVVSSIVLLRVSLIIIIKL